MTKHPVNTVRGRWITLITGVLVATEIDALLRKAIEEKRLVELVSTRNAESSNHMTTVSRTGSIKLLGYQFSAGGSAGAKLTMD